MLPGQLLGVGEVLVLAAAAAAIEGAGRRDPVGRGDQHLDQVGLRVVLVVAEDPHAHPFAREGEGIITTQPGAGLSGRMTRASPDPRLVRVAISSSSSW